MPTRLADELATGRDGRNRQKLRRRRVEPVCKRDDDLDRRIAHTALDAGDVGAIDTELQGQGLLRKPGLGPHPPDVLSEQFDVIHHADMAPSCGLNVHGLSVTSCLRVAMLIIVYKRSEAAERYA